MHLFIPLYFHSHKLPLIHPNHLIDFELSSLSHLLGKNSLVHLSVPIGSTELHLHARIPGLSWFETGKNVFVEIDPKQVFIFPEQNT